MARLRGIIKYNQIIAKIHKDIMEIFTKTQTLKIQEIDNGLKSIKNEIQQKEGYDNVDVEKMFKKCNDGFCKKQSRKY